MNLALRRHLGRSLADRHDRHQPPGVRQFGGRGRVARDGNRLHCCRFSDHGCRLRLGHCYRVVARLRRGADWGGVNWGGASRCRRRRRWGRGALGTGNHLPHDGVSRDIDAQRANDQYAGCQCRCDSGHVVRPLPYRVKAGCRNHTPRRARGKQRIAFHTAVDGPRPPMTRAGQILRERRISRPRPTERENRAIGRGLPKAPPGFSGKSGLFWQARTGSTS